MKSFAHKDMVLLFIPVKEKVRKIKKKPQKTTRLNKMAARETRWCLVEKDNNADV